MIGRVVAEYTCEGNLTAERDHEELWLSDAHGNIAHAEDILENESVDFDDLNIPDCLAEGKTYQLRVQLVEQRGSHPPAPLPSSTPQPIDTAPKDREILAWWPWVNSTGRWSVTTWEDHQFSKRPNPYWESKALHMFGIHRMRNNPPTHWIELPEAP